MTLTVEIAVEAEGWAAVMPPEADVACWVAAAAAEAGFPPDEDAEIAVLLCDDTAIRTLNRQWRDKDAATNVLSFPAAGPPPPVGPRPLGDVAVALETTRREAQDEGKSPVAHLAHLLVHGTLHLLGHDHHGSAEADAMEAAERRVLARFGFDDPYAGSEPLVSAPS